MTKFDKAILGPKKLPEIWKDPYSAIQIPLQKKLKRL